MRFAGRNSCWSNKLRCNALLITGPKCSCLICYLEIISSCSGRLISIYDVFIVDNLILLLMQCSFGFQTISKQFLSFFGRNNTRNTIFNDNRIFFGKYGCIRVVPVKIENRSVAYDFQLRNYLLSHHHASAASSCPPRCPCSLR